jgi:hypothetical protein
VSGVSSGTFKIILIISGFTMVGCGENGTGEENAFTHDPAGMAHNKMKG